MKLIKVYIEPPPVEVVVICQSVGFVSILWDKPRFYVSTSKSIIKALINMHSFEIQLSPIG
ncbi:TPA: hypothetical protein HMQ00_24010 [Escherichia coli]|nr:hypothetical protein [Escherichia coli]HAJ2583904.1 hypothetical protein [Escherichia coli]